MSRDDESASSNPLFVMADEKSGARYARAVGRKGLGTADEMDWLVQDISKTLKSWGHTGGSGGHLIFKSDGEPALMAVKNAVMQYHGGVCIPEQPAQGEKAENGLIAEAGKIIQGVLLHISVPDIARSLRCHPALLRHYPLDSEVGSDLLFQIQNGSRRQDILRKTKGTVLQVNRNLDGRDGALQGAGRWWRQGEQSPVRVVQGSLARTSRKEYRDADRHGQRSSKSSHRGEVVTFHEVGH